MMKKSSFALLGAIMLVSGCATRETLYFWGNYQPQVYAQYSDPGKVPVEEQLAKLEADYQKARSLNKPVPPGFHAHTGYLYFQLGKMDQSVQSFETEKTLYPESKIYMDRLIATIKNKRKL